MKIQIENPDTADIKGLLEAHLADMAKLSPPDSVHALDSDGLIHPSVVFWAGRSDDCGELLGCGALKDLGQRQGEIKSMRTALAHRRRGVAAQLLNHIIQYARNHDFEQLNLETGSAPAFEPARLMYERFGFVSCEPFGNYRPDVHSVFMTLALR